MCSVASSARRTLLTLARLRAKIPSAWVVVDEKWAWSVLKVPRRLYDGRALAFGQWDHVIDSANNVLMSHVNSESKQRDRE